MRAKKIIHVYYRSYDSFFPENDSDYYFLAGWSGAIARRTVEHTDKYCVENWRPERDVASQLIRSVHGVTCRLFPARHVPYFGDYSPSMVWELKRQSREHDVLIHHNGIHSNPLYLMTILLRNIPIVAQHHGDSPSMVRFRQNGRLLNLFSSIIERKALSHIDHFFVLRKSEASFLSGFLPKSRITPQTVGVDYEVFRPLGRDRARRALGLSNDAVIMVYVGKFYRLKGVDLILQAYQALRTRMKVDLVLIGGSPEDELYEDVKASGARHYGHLPHDRIPLYLSAADVYLLPSFAADYWGIDVSVIEALACGVPVVSPILAEFPDDIRTGLGEIPSDRKDVVRCISAILENPLKHARCREISRGYYDWPDVIRRTDEVYDSLFGKYYNSRPR